MRSRTFTLLRLKYLDTTFENKKPVAEFKEFERRFKFKPRLKYGWLKFVSNVSRFKPALNLNRVLADLNRSSNSLNS